MPPCKRELLHGVRQEVVEAGAVRRGGVILGAERVVVTAQCCLGLRVCSRLQSIKEQSITCVCLSMCFIMVCMCLLKQRSRFKTQRLPMFVYYVCYSAHVFVEAKVKLKQSLPMFVYIMHVIKLVNLSKIT